MSNAITEFGFQFGAALVERLTQDPRHGVWLSIKTPRAEVVIRVTKSGLFRIGRVKPKKGKK